MRITVSRQALLDALQAAVGVVGVKPMKPILENVLIRVERDALVVQATDLEVAVTCRVPVVATEGAGDAFLVSAMRLHGVVREALTESMAIEVEDRVVRAVAGKSVFRIQGDDPEEYPRIPAFGEGKSLRVPRERLRNLIEKTYFAAARDHVRYAVNGIRLEITSEGVRAIGTDGKRMAVQFEPVDNPDGITAANIVPTKGALSFLRILSEDTADEFVEIASAEKAVLLRASAGVVLSRIIEGTFPDYQRVIPAETPIVATANRQDLIAAFRQASLLTCEESKSVVVGFQPDALVLSSHAAGVGDARVEVAASCTGEPIEIAYIPEYVIEGLKAMSCETVRICASGRDTPSRLDGDENYTYIVMPVTIRRG